MLDLLGATVHEAFLTHGHVYRVRFYQAKCV